MSTTTYAVMKSNLICEVFERAERIAKFPTTVLIEGESGVGKEIVANWIHHKSPRMNMPFIKINCASLPETLLESELFGYERGAFTGAKREGNPGLFELADKGTLLLDEVSELNHSMQAKLLRVLQDREVRRVGGSWSRIIDVRIIASTNRGLRDSVQKGLFREDLFYRLHVAHVQVPSLRERREDIMPLLDYFLNQMCMDFSISRTLSREAKEQLLNYDFPGNVRELRNLLEGLCVSIPSELITWDDLPSHVKESLPVDASLTAQTEHFERTVIMQILKEEPSIRRAAARLQISHSTLLRKINKYQIDINETTPTIF